MSHIFIHNDYEIRHRFRSLAHVQRLAPDFRTWYLDHYFPPALDGLTPSQVQTHARRRLLKQFGIFRHCLRVHFPPAAARRLHAHQIGREALRRRELHLEGCRIHRAVQLTVPDREGREHRRQAALALPHPERLGRQPLRQRVREGFEAR